ncbi:hypothetical protein ACFX11_019424 [Malus domestica]
MGKGGKAGEPENMDARPFGVHNIKIQPFKLPNVEAHDVRVRIKAVGIIKSQSTLCGSPSTNRISALCGVGGDLDQYGIVFISAAELPVCRVEDSNVEIWDRDGSHPKRAIGDGYWKATGADKEVKSSDGAVVR